MTALAVRPSPKARDVAFAVIRDVFGPSARGAAEALDYHLRKHALDPRDRAFATELAYSTIERRRWLDYQLEPYLGERARTIPQMILEILRMGTQQLRGMRVHDYAAVSESVQLARRFGHPGTAGLVNAVLRRVAAEPERPIEADSPDDEFGIRYSLPTWLVRHWRARFGDERLVEIVAGVNAPAAIALAVDERRGTPAELIATLATRGIQASPSSFARSTVVISGTVPTGTLLAAVAQRAEIHAEAACFPADLLDPQSGERVLELCCGRGNKTLQIVAATGDAASITAVDVDERKLRQLRERLASHDMHSVAIVTRDASDLSGLREAEAVLVDAPCSGLGIIGRQPEARWRKTPDDGARLALQQRAILSAAAQKVAPGGRLVYAVCSTDPRECEDIVAPLLADGSFTRSPLPERYAPFTTDAGDVLVPPGVEGRDGFYVATLRRT